MLLPNVTSHNLPRSPPRTSLDSLPIRSRVAASGWSFSLAFSTRNNKIIHLKLDVVVGAEEQRHRESLNTSSVHRPVDCGLEDIICRQIGERQHSNLVRLMDRHTRPSRELVAQTI